MRSLNKQPRLHTCLTWFNMFLSREDHSETFELSRPTVFIDYRRTQIYNSLLRYYSLRVLKTGVEIGLSFHFYPQYWSHEGSLMKLRSMSEETFKFGSTIVLCFHVCRCQFSVIMITDETRSNIAELNQVTTVMWSTFPFMIIVWDDFHCQEKSTASSFLSLGLELPSLQKRQTV